MQGSWLSGLASLIGKPAAPGDKDKQGEAPAAPGDKDKQGEAPAIPGDKAKQGETPVAPGDKDKEGETPATPTVAELEARAKAGERILLTDLAAASKAERKAQQDKKPQTADAGKDKPSQPAAEDKGKETDEALTAAIEGPSGTSITQIFDKRLSPPDEASRKILVTMLGNKAGHTR